MNADNSNSGLQSGEQSKSSEIIIETDEALQEQRVCKCVVTTLGKNTEWNNFCTKKIEPLVELEKGKLGQDEENNNTGSEEGSDSNIFDDDFMRSDFNVVGDSQGAAGGENAQGGENEPSG